MVTHTDYADLVRELHQAAEEYDRGHGPLHAAAANAIAHLTTMASGETATASNGDAQIRRAAEETAPSAQIVRTDGDLLVYYSGFNLSKFVRFLALQPHVVSQDGAAQPVVATAELTGADLGRWCYENPNLAARTIEGLRGVAQAHPACKAECDGQMQLAMAEIERIRAAIFEIQKATLEGRVCNDVAWFDGTTTLHDFCDFILNGPDDGSPLSSTAAPAQPSQDEMENYRLALAWIKGQSTDPQAKEIAATALDAYSASPLPPSHQPVTKADQP